MSDQTPQVHVFHDLHPEDVAMLQALYSRSPAGVLSHLDKVKNAGSGKFMEKFYVGYGHASIGDCGVTSVFVENYSMLAAKAIQDNPLYSGQEASTRYLDFSVQPMHDPYKHPAAQAILDGWMDLYNSWMPRVIEALKEKYPFDETQYRSKKGWENTVNARAFDIMRGFLPIGTTTLLSWTTNLRQARDRLMQLKNHPLEEVRTMAHDVFKQLTDQYPNSFTGDELSETAERYAERDAYARKHAEENNYQSFAQVKQQFGLSEVDVQSLKNGDMLVRDHQMDIDGLNVSEKTTLSERPKGADLPKRLASYGHYHLMFLLDFGSYRDLQRHRGGFCRLPLVEPTFGMHKWYMEELKALLPQSFAELEATIKHQFAAIEALPQQGVATTTLKNQYLLPMGINVCVQLTYHLPQMVYVGELRSEKTVHASLRPIAQQMLQIMAKRHPDMALYGDMDADNWSAKRGDQTIMEKAS